MSDLVWEPGVADPKVHAAASVCHQQIPRMELHARRERFRRLAVRTWPADRTAAVFCCVDAIVTRKLIWDALRATAVFFADRRIAAEVVWVPMSGQPAADTRYPTTLFSAAEEYAGSCTSKATIYAASVAAGLLMGPVRAVAAGPVGGPGPDGQPSRGRAVRVRSVSVTWRTRFQFELDVAEGRPRRSRH